MCKPRLTFKHTWSVGLSPLNLPIASSASALLQDIDHDAPKSELTQCYALFDRHCGPAFQVDKEIPKRANQDSKHIKISESRVEITALPVHEYQPTMCIHRLYIHTVCGHSLYAPNPSITCEHASIPPDGSFSTSCDLIAHPYQSWRLNSLCSSCESTRARLMQRIDAEQAIAYDEVKWKVSYGMPTHGLDLWGKRAAEREKPEKETGERKRRSVRFSWRRKRRNDSYEERDVGVAGSAKNAKLDPHWLRDPAGAGTSAVESSTAATSRRTTYAYQH